MKLYGILKPDGDLIMNSYDGENLFATTNKRFAKSVARQRNYELVRLEVNYFFITPTRRAKTARTEGKQMAKAKKAAPAKAPAKKGKK